MSLRPAPVTPAREMTPSRERTVYIRPGGVPSPPADTALPVVAETATDRSRAARVDLRRPRHNLFATMMGDAALEERGPIKVSPCQRISLPNVDSKLPSWFTRE